MGYKVVVAGATGNVGREMLNILAEREFPVDEIAVLASRRSLGTEVSFGDRTLKTQDIEQFDFTGWDMALFAIGSDATKTYAPRAAEAGCVVIDNSSLYRYDPDVPLVVPEINASDIDWHAGLLAIPNCSTTPLVMAANHRSVPTARAGLMPKKRIRIGAISEPPPTPVSPTRKLTKAPASE